MPDSVEFGAKAGACWADGLHWHRSSDHVLWRVQHPGLIHSHTRTHECVHKRTCNHTHRTRSIRHRTKTQASWTTVEGWNPPSSNLTVIPAPLTTSPEKQHARADSSTTVVCAASQCGARPESCDLVETIEIVVTSKLLLLGGRKLPNAPTSSPRSLTIKLLP